METIGELNILFDLQCSPCCKWFCNCDQGRWDGELKRRGRGERGGKRRWRGAAILFGSHLIREAGSPKSGFPLFRPPVHTVERALCTNLIAKAKAEILGAVKGGWMLQLKLRLKKPRMQEREREKIEKVRIMREGGWRCPERWSWVGESWTLVAIAPLQSVSGRWESQIGEKDNNNDEDCRKAWLGLQDWGCNRIIIDNSANSATQRPFISV